VYEALIAVQTRKAAIIDNSGMPFLRLLLDFYSFFLFIIVLLTRGHLFATFIARVALHPEIVVESSASSKSADD